MKITHKIIVRLDDNRGPALSVDVMQGDAYTRELEFTLYSGGEEWNVPDGVTVAVAYRGASGHGIYDTLPDGAAAYAVADNVVTVTLIPQVAAAKGDTVVTVLFTDANGKQLATFGVVVRVAPNPAIGAGKPEDYYNIREWFSSDFKIHVFPGGPNGYATDESYDKIRENCEAGRTAICDLEVDGQVVYPLPLTMRTIDTFYFSAVCQGVERMVIISRNADDGSALVTVVDGATTGQLTLTDRVTGALYALYIKDGHPYIEPGGTGTVAQDSVVLADRSTGGNYEIYIRNGDLVIAESEA